MRRAFVCHYLPSACKLGHYLRYHRGSIPPTTRSRRRGDPHTSAVFSQAARERYLRPSALTARTGYGTTRTVDDGGAALILAFVGVLMRIGCFIARVLGRTPNLRFEFLATWPGAILAAGSQRVPLYAPRPGWGKGSLSRRDAVAKLPIWGLTCGYFRGLWISSGLKNQNSLLCW